MIVVQFTRSIKDQTVVLFSNNKDILCRWRECLKDLLNPITSTPADTQEVHLGEGNTSLQMMSSLLPKHWRLGRRQAVIKSRPEIIKILESGRSWEGIEKSANCGDHSHTQKGRQEWMHQISGAFVSLASLEKSMSLLWKKCRKIIEENLDDTQYGFRPSPSTTDQNFTLQQIFKKSWEYTKDVYICFVDFEKAYDWVPREKLWGVLRENGVDGNLLLTVNTLYFSSEVCVRVGGGNSQQFNVRCWTLTRVCAVTTPLHSLIHIWFALTFAAQSTRLSLLGLAGSTVCFLGTVGTANIFSTAPPACTQLVFCDQAGMKISTEKTEILGLWLSRISRQCMLQVSGNTLVTGGEVPWSTAVVPKVGGIAPLGARIGENNTKEAKTLNH